MAAGMFWTFESVVGKGAALSRNFLNCVLVDLRSQRSPAREGRHREAPVRRRGSCSDLRVVRWTPWSSRRPFFSTKSPSFPREGFTCTSPEPARDTLEVARHIQRRLS